MKGKIAIISILVLTLLIPHTSTAVKSTNEVTDNFPTLYEGAYYNFSRTRSGEGLQYYYGFREINVTKIVGSTIYTFVHNCFWFGNGTLAGNTTYHDTHGENLDGRFQYYGLFYNTSNINKTVQFLTNYNERSSDKWNYSYDVHNETYKGYDAINVTRSYIRYSSYHSANLSHWYSDLIRVSDGVELKGINIVDKLNSTRQTTAMDSTTNSHIKKSITKLQNLKFSEREPKQRLLWQQYWYLIPITVIPALVTIYAWKKRHQ